MPRKAKRIWGLGNFPSLSKEHHQLSITAAAAAGELILSRFKAWQAFCLARIEHCCGGFEIWGSRSGITRVFLNTICREKKQNSQVRLEIGRWFDLRARSTASLPPSSLASSLLPPFLPSIFLSFLVDSVCIHHIVSYLSWSSQASSVLALCSFTENDDVGQ